MDKKTPEMMRAFYGRAVPVMPELFNMAYAICGNFDLAEYALQCALLEVWFGESHGGIGFKESLRNAVRHFSAVELLEMRAGNVEATWNGLDAAGDDPVLEILVLESAEVRRMAALRYGCGLTHARIAQLMDVPVGSVKDALFRLEKRLRRRHDSQKRRPDAELTAAIRAEFRRTDENMPALSTIYRAFATEAVQVRRPKYLLSKLLKRASAVLLALACAFAFWLAAALIRPVEMETPQQIAAESAESDVN